MKKNFGEFDPGKILIIAFVLMLIGGGIFFFVYNLDKEDKGIPCEEDADCDDNDLCTVDSCLLKSKICYNFQKKCPLNQFCNSLTGNCETREQTPQQNTVPENENLQPNTNNLCSATHLEYCLNQNECENANGFWYGSKCNEDEEETENNAFQIPPPPALPS